MLRIACLDVSFLELLEQRALLAIVAGPDVAKPGIDALGLGAQECQIVHVRCVERANQQHAMIEKLC